ncbi:DUF6491 family protein [Sphingomonas flavalba]|uniref:DUF6491 family protein n=1 Tax=Sphingomonas flavalba TaxID=2559804 RepID=UPI0039DF9ABE
MKSNRLGLALAALAGAALFAAPGAAKDQKPRVLGVEASIPFASSSINSWQADGNDAVYIQDLRRQWYRATLIGPCTELPFANAVGFDAGRALNTLDRFSTIVVRGQRCPLTSLVTSAPPPAKAKKKG